MEEFNQALGQFLASLWTHRWTFGLPVALMFVPATLRFVRQPQTYESQVLVHAQPLQSRGTGGVLPRILEPRPRDAVAYAGGALFNSRNLEQAAPILAPGRRAGDRGTLRALEHRFTYAREGETSFSVACTDTSPQRAAAAANALVRAFLESERTIRQERAAGYLEFQARELAAAREALRKAQERLAAFNGEHQGTLPENEPAVTRRVTLLREELVRNETAAAAAAVRAEELQAELDGLAPESIDVADDPAAAAARARLEALLAEQQRVLVGAQAELDKVRAEYTDEQEEVQHIVARVEAQQQRLDATRARIQQLEEGEAERRRARQQSGLVLRRRTLDTRREGALRERETAASRARDAGEELARLRAALDAVAATGARQAPLVCDMEAARATVDELDRETRQARAIALFCEKGDTGEVTGYRVNEWAVAPATPAGPSMLKHYVTAGLLGVVLGYLLLARRRHARRQVVTDPAEVGAILPHAQVLALSGGPLSFLRRGAHELFCLAIFLASLSLSAFLLAAARGWVETPPWLEGIL